MKASDWAELTRRLLHDPNLRESAHAGHFGVVRRAGFDLDADDIGLLQRLDSVTDNQLLSEGQEQPFEWVLAPGFTREFVAQFEVTLQVDNAANRALLGTWFDLLWRTIAKGDWRAQALMNLVGTGTFRCSVAWTTQAEASTYQLVSLPAFVALGGLGNFINGLVVAPPTLFNTEIWEMLYNEDQDTFVTGNPSVRHWRWTVNTPPDLPAWQFVRELSLLVTELVALPVCTGSVAERRSGFSNEFQLFAAFPAGTPIGAVLVGLGPMHPVNQWFTNPIHMTNVAPTVRDFDVVDNRMTRP